MARPWLALADPIEVARRLFFLRTAERAMAEQAPGEASAPPREPLALPTPPVYRGEHPKRYCPKQLAFLGAGSAGRDSPA
jgi:hypothetical protein